MLSTKYCVLLFACCCCQSLRVVCCVFLQVNSASMTFTLITACSISSTCACMQSRKRSSNHYAYDDQLQTMYSWKLWCIVCSILHACTARFVTTVWQSFPHCTRQYKLRVCGVNSTIRNALHVSFRLLWTVTLARSQPLNRSSRTMQAYVVELQ